MEKDIKYYMDLPYNFIIQPVNDESGSYYYGRIMELDGCQSSGETFAEAFESLHEAMEGWIETKLSHNLPVPEPVSIDDGFSGKFVVRLPKTLHQKLAMEASTEGVSLNQYVLYKLAQ